jgi:type I restriction enzyme R subunit
MHGACPVGMDDDCGMSREICVDLYDAIIKLKPEWYDEDPNKGAIKIMVTGSTADHKKLQAHIYDKKTKKLFEKRFKATDDELKFVIVPDMWLTGFDGTLLSHHVHR